MGCKCECLSWKTWRTQGLLYAELAHIIETMQSTKHSVVRERNLSQQVLFKSMQKL